MSKDLLIPRNILYLLIIVGFVINFLNLVLKLEDYGISDSVGKSLVFFAMLASFIATAVLIIDVFVNNVDGKYLWTLVFLFSGGFLGYFYLRNRSYYTSKSK
ncbi:hypothetical protein FNJ88_04225 [Chryseobacterium sp. SNU WT5]|uniref:hypothetical protein n=1 Tax=Chryseobacterium sp. SNU WT5 TaxID=2594269 RepID=UPI00117C0FF0|nr:hypothetical protein [Chryseobacterium sp. SNU WT5]QDP84795.1 hypothetical protein FNJ88_04225 [Chryseobacterium sp. SNU WT5]